MKQAANFAGFGCAAVLLTAMGFIGGLSVGRSSVHRFTKGPSAGIAFDQATGSLCFAGFGKHSPRVPACADLASGRVDTSRLAVPDQTFSVPLDELHDDPREGDAVAVKQAEKK